MLVLERERVREGQTCNLGVLGRCSNQLSYSLSEVLIQI